MCEALGEHRQISRDTNRGPDSPVQRGHPQDGIIPSSASVSIAAGSHMVHTLSTRQQGYFMSNRDSVGSSSGSRSSHGDMWVRKIKGVWHCHEDRSEPFWSPGKAVTGLSGEDAAGQVCGGNPELCVPHGQFPSDPREARGSPLGCNKTSTAGPWQSSAPASSSRREAPCIWNVSLTDGQRWLSPFFPLPARKSVRACGTVPVGDVDPGVSAPA